MEPERKEDEEELEFLRRWSVWARSSIDDLRAEVCELKIEAGVERSSAKEMKVQRDAFELALSKRSRLAIHEPGCTLHLPDGLPCTVRAVSILPGPSVVYTVSWWRNNQRYEATVGSDEVEVELPLPLPSYPKEG